MALPRRKPSPHDDELPALPPLDGDDEAAPVDVPLDVALDDGDASLDDSAADELTDDALDEPVDLAHGDDDAPIDTGDDADEIDDDGESWSGDAEREQGEADDVDDLDALPPDDRGAEGPEGETDDLLDALPPLDDDADGDRTLDEGDAIPELAAFALPTVAGVEVQVLLAPSHTLATMLGVAPGVAAGGDHAYIAAETVVAWPPARVGDGDAAVMLDAPTEEVFCDVAETHPHVVTLATLTGALWRRGRAREAWRRVGRFGDERATGPVTLRAEASRLWALTSDGTLWREDDGRFEPTLATETVRAVAVDAHGGALVALGGVRRDALRATTDGRTWRALALPEESAVGCVARRGDVCAAAHGEGAGGGWVSVDGGARWTRWPLLDAATSLLLVETDDGEARLVFAVHDEASDRVLLAMARVGGDGVAEGARALVDVGAAFPRGEEDDDGGAARVTRIEAVDRAGRRLLVATTRGAVLLVSLR